MTSAKNNSAEPTVVVTQYETLRSVALGEALPPEARGGLLLFLRRGMYGWSRTVAAALSSPPQPTRSPPSNWKGPEEYRTAIHIFAALAIGTSPYGATP